MFFIFKLLINKLLNLDSCQKGIMNKKIITLCASPLSFFNRLIVSDRRLHETYSRLMSENPPKRPNTPYLRYFFHVLPDLTEKFPSASRKEIMKMAGSSWKSLDNTEKMKFRRAYYEDYEQYNLACLQYESKLKNQVEVAKNLEPLEKAVEKRKLKEMRKLSGRPKKSLSAFILFLKSKKETFPKGVKAPEWTKHLADEYRNLPPEEKMKFKRESEKLNDAYRKAISEWEDKLIKSGHTEILFKRSQFGENITDIKDR